MGEVEDYLLNVLCPTITVNPTRLANGVVGTAYSQTATATGGATPYLFAVSNGRLPLGLALNSSGVLSGTPTQTTARTFTVSATDANGCIGTRPYTVTPVCPTITVNPTSLANGTVGLSYSQTASATGGSAPYTFAVSAGILPAGLALNSSTGAITGTPTTANGAGTSITIRATDANGCQGTQAYTLKVCPVIPMSPATLANGTVGSAYSQTVSATGGAAPYVYALSSGTLPTGLNLDPATGAFTGTPTQTAARTFIVRTTDANGCTGTRSYTITPACPVITITPSTITAYLGFAFSQSLSGSGGSAPYTSWTVTSGTMPAGLTLNSSGLISGTPTTVGSTAVTVRANDIYGCQGTRSITITVKGLTVGNLVWQDNNNNEGMPTATALVPQQCGGCLGSADLTPIGASSVSLAGPARMEAGPADLMSS